MRATVTLAIVASMIAIGPVSAQDQATALAQDEDPAATARFWPGGQIPQRQVIFFSGSNFTGNRFAVTGPRANLRVPFLVRSVVVLRSESWDVCLRADYRSCSTLRSSSRNVTLLVRSARPHDDYGGTVGGQSLRGMASQYFPAPTLNGRRVAVPQGNAAAAQERANRFCQRAGFNYSRWQMLQTVSGQHYLADVLCTRS